MANRRVPPAHANRLAAPSADGAIGFARCLDRLLALAVDCAAEAITVQESGAAPRCGVAGLPPPLLLRLALR